MIEHDDGFGALRFEIKPDGGRHTRVPMGGPPCLHDPLCADELYVSTDDESPERRKGAACLRVDRGGHAG